MGLLLLKREMGFDISRGIPAGLVSLAGCFFIGKFWEFYESSRVDAQPRSIERVSRVFDGKGLCARDDAGCLDCV